MSTFAPHGGVVRVSPVLWKDNARRIRHIELLPTEESGKRCQFIIAHPNPSPVVDSITISTYTDWLSHVAWYPKVDDPEDYVKKSLPESVEAAIWQIGKLENLRSVELRFESKCNAPDRRFYHYNDTAPESFEFRKRVFMKLFESMVHASNGGNRIRHLSIKNLQNVIDEEMGKLSADALHLMQLESLALQICHEYHEKNASFNYGNDELHFFYNAALMKYFLNPAKDHLQHLKLYSHGVYWGYYPACDLRNMHFPKLKSLHLGNFTFAFDWQLEWILSHGETLEELVLDDCPLLHYGTVSNPNCYEHIVPSNIGDIIEERHGARRVTEGWTYDTRWHDYFRRLKDGLPNLKRFGMGHGLWEDDLMFDTSSDLGLKLETDRYGVFHAGTLPTPFCMSGCYGHGYRYFPIEISPPACGEEDQALLDELVDAIRERNGM